MGTAFLADSSQILRAHPRLDFASGKIYYTITTRADGTSSYSVTDGSRTLSAPLLWAFGTGSVGQSYLFEKPKDDSFYEVRVTWFDAIKALHFTPGRVLTNPKDLDEAMYRSAPPSEVIRRFSCHVTASTIGNQFVEKNLIPGVTCEACRGPGLSHVSTMQAA